MPYLIQNPEAPNQQIYQLSFGSNTIGRELDNSIVVLDVCASETKRKAIPLTQ